MKKLAKSEEIKQNGFFNFTDYRIEKSIRFRDRYKVKIFFIPLT